MFKTFDELQKFKCNPDLNNLHPASFKMERRKGTFENGYGFSIVRGRGSYGYEVGLYELAVMLDGSCCYSTEITDDVLGYLTQEDVVRYVNRIEAL